MLNKFFIMIIFLYLITLICSNDKAGVRVAITQDVVQNFEKQFLPLALQQLGTINIPDQSIDVDVKISTLHIHLQSIELNISKLIADNIHVNFVSPNYIQINAQDIEGSGHFKANYKLGFYSEDDDVDISIKWVNVNALIQLGTTPSNKVPGKLLPFGSIQSLDLDLDIDFDIHGSIIAKIVDLVKDIIKKKIISLARGVIQQQIVEKSGEITTNLVNLLPVYVPLPGVSLAVDYSLLSDPKVENGYLVISSNGAIVDLSHPESMNPPFEIPDTLPDYDSNGKGAQAFITDYSINTAANSLYLSGLLNVVLKPSYVPSNFPFQLNTSTMETLLPGIKNLYGDKPVNIACQATGAPFAGISASLLTAKLFETCSIYVILDDDSQDNAYTFKTEIDASGMVIIASQGQISGSISEMSLNNSTQIFSKLPEADISVVQMMFNFATKMALPYVNDQIIKSIHISLPTVQGISFNDSTLNVNDRYIEINLNPIIVSSYLKSFLEDFRKLDSLNTKTKFLQE